MLWSFLPPCRFWCPWLTFLLPPGLDKPSCPLLPWCSGPHSLDCSLGRWTEQWHHPTPTPPLPCPALTDSLAHSPPAARLRTWRKGGNRLFPWSAQWILLSWSVSSEWGGWCLSGSPHWSWSPPLLGAPEAKRAHKIFWYFKIFQFHWRVFLMVPMYQQGHIENQLFATIIPEEAINPSRPHLSSCS